MVKILLGLLNSSLAIASHSIGDVAGDGYGAGDNYSIVGRALGGAPAPTQQSNANYAIVPGAGFKITSDSVFSTAGYLNSFGIYFLDGSSHPISGVVVFRNVKETLGEGKSITTNFATKDIPSGAVEFGFFIIPNGHRLNRKLVNGDKVTFAQNGRKRWAAFLDQIELHGAQGAPAYFSLANLNPDKRKHMTTKNNEGKSKLGFEDLLGGGDNDFDDAVINVIVEGYGTAPSQASSESYGDGNSSSAPSQSELNCQTLARRTSKGHQSNVLPRQPEFSWSCHDLMRYYSRTHNKVLNPSDIKLRLNGLATAHTCETYGKRKPICTATTCHDLEYCEPDRSTILL